MTQKLLTDAIDSHREVSSVACLESEMDRVGADDGPACESDNLDDELRP